MSLRPLLTALFTLVTLTSAAAMAQEKPLIEPIGVAPVDDNSSSEPVAIHIVDTLGEHEKTTMNAAQIDRMLSEHRVDLVEVDTKEFNAVVKELEENSQIYYHVGAARASKAIEGRLLSAIDDLDALIVRKDKAATVYEAGLQLLASYRDQGMDDKADLQARRLAANFPSRVPSPKTASPGLIEHVQDARTALASEKTKLQIKPFRAKQRATECRYYINGFEAKSTQAYTVTADQEYLLQMDCNVGANPVAWRVRPEAGKTNVVPIIDVDPLKMDMQDNSFEARTEVEQRILFILHWTGLETFVGVSKSAAMGTDQSVLLVYVTTKEKQALWSDGASQKSLCTALTGWFPSLEVTCEEPLPPKRQRPAWPLLVSTAGLITAGAGGGLWLTQDNFLKDLRCSKYADPLPNDCNGTSDIEVEYDNVEQIEADILLAERHRTIGIGMVAAGGAFMLGGLVYYAFSGKPPETQVLFSPTRDGVGVGFQRRF